MNKIALSAAVLVLALSPLSPAAFARDWNDDGDRHHDARPGHHYGHGYRHGHRHHYRHHHRHGWYRHHDYRHHDRHVVHYGHDRDFRVVLPAPPLPVILPPHFVLKHAR